MSDSAFNWNAFLQIASISDVGMRRSSNQDNLAVTLASSINRWQEKGHLFMVADGMGAHAAGELASEIACDQVPQLYNKYDQLSSPEALKKAVVETNAIINRKGQANEEFFNMGTTCSVLTLLPQGAVVAHIGDSRVYMLRKNELMQLTFDHSLVWEMRAGGHLSAADEAANFIPKNVITRSLGPYPDVKVDLEGPFPIEKGDTFLLCSDGLTGLVKDDELGSILANLPPNEAVQVLTDLTNLRGGPDNITIIVVRVIHDQMATFQSGKQPLTIRAKKTQPVHPFTWACLAGLVIAAVILGIVTWNLVAALIPGVGALIALMWIAIKMGGTGASSKEVSEGQRFGHGPHVRVNCVAGEKLVSKLKEITAELRAAAKLNNLDASAMDIHLTKAIKSTENKNFANAIRDYARSISIMMDQLRTKNRRQATDSSVDL